MAEQVGILKQFRDQVLLDSEMGRSMVAFYYRLSPPAARWIARHETARTMVRLALWPVVAFCALWLKSGTVFHLLILFTPVVGAFSLMLIGWRRRRSHNHSQLS